MLLGDNMRTSLSLLDVPKLRELGEVSLVLRIWTTVTPHAVESTVDEKHHYSLEIYSLPEPR